MVVVSGGGLVAVAAGDALVMPYPGGGEVYSIKGALFDTTYAFEDPQSRVPTHDEMVVEWTTVLQNKEGSLHRKSGVVFAKAAGDNNDPAVPTQVFDDHVIEVTWD